MADGNSANFRAVYDELTDEVDRAKYQFLPEHLTNWFRTLDTTPTITAMIRDLESGIDFQEWRRKLTSAVAQRRIEWPAEPKQALGMKLLLFRDFGASSPDKISHFGFSFMRVGNNLNDNAHVVIDQIFMPMARELRRHLENEIAKIPAADRAVTLDHNSAMYRDALDALQKLEEVLREANDYPDDEDKEQRIAELSAVQRLLKSARVRVAAVVSVIGTGLTYLVTHFVGTAIDTASHRVIETLTALFGAYF